MILIGSPQPGQRSGSTRYVRANSIRHKQSTGNQGQWHPRGGGPCKAGTSCLNERGNAAIMRGRAGTPIASPRHPIVQIMTSFELEAPFPLSPIQQGMLYHHLADPRSGVDIEQIFCRFRDELDPHRFHAAWRHVVSRHPMLRASCSWKTAGEPTQQVHAAIDLPLGFEDWTGQVAAEQEQRLSAFLEEDRKRGFDLASPPLLRVQMFRLAPGVLVCVWTVHHLVCDGRSFEIVLEMSSMNTHDSSRLAKPRLDNCSRQSTRFASTSRV